MKFYLLFSFVLETGKGH